MGWKDELIAKNNDSIANAQKAIDLLENKKMDMGEIEDSGETTSMRDQLIETNKRIIRDLEEANKTLKGGNP